MAALALASLAISEQQVVPGAQLPVHLLRMWPRAGDGPWARGRCYVPARRRPQAARRCGQERVRPFFIASAGKPGITLRRPAFPANAKYVDAHTRNPMLLLRLFGLFLLRYAQRTFLRLLLNEPPRTTRRLGTRPHNSGRSRVLSKELCTARPVPTAQQAADFGCHAGHVPVLTICQPAPANGQPQIQPHPVERLVSGRELRYAPLAAAMIGGVQALAQIESRIQQPARESVPVRTWKVVRHSVECSRHSVTQYIHPATAGRGDWVTGNSHVRKSNVRVNIGISAFAIRMSPGRKELHFGELTQSRTPSHHDAVCT